MEFLKNQNLSLGSQPDVIRLESQAELSSSAVNNIIIMLGVLTFVLQLCLAVLYMLRCWRFDNRVREALKHPETAKKVLGMKKGYEYHLYNETTDTPSPAIPAAVESYKHSTDSLCGPPIHWDLVQY